jgi:single-stranded-DNA-specific exonuclease
MNNDSSYRWTIATPSPDALSRVEQACDVSQLVAKCLVNRGHSDPADVDRFLDPKLRSLADPFLIPDMGIAVERLFRGRAEKGALVIFGDYDVDGVTATTLLTEVLSSLGWSVFHYLPHRLEEGYGLSQAAVEKCLAKHPVGLFLAVDCGSTAVTQIEWLHSQNVDVIVLDHHQLSSPPPAAHALVNPQRAASEELKRPPFAELCSAGLAFKLAHAVLKRGRELGFKNFAEFDLRPFLELVALGTVADLVPLIGENRILVTSGLERLQNTTRPGLVALKTVSQTNGSIGVYEVGFQLAPRLNAAGRMESADEALNLLLTHDPVVALQLATSLDARNRERQQIERTISTEATSAVRARFDPARDFVIIEGSAQWHIGVVGIVASRVLREFYRPTLILGGDGTEWRGSGRSIAGFDLAAALRECDDLLIKHGGHAMAAGVSIVPENLEAFRTRLNEIAKRHLTPELLRPELFLDAEVTLADLSLDQLEELDRLRPFGQENSEIRLCSRRVSLAKPPQRMGKEQQHARLALTDQSQPATGPIECVWWSCADRPLPHGVFDAAFAPSINEYNGRRTVQLKLLDWRPSGH